MPKFTILEKTNLQEDNWHSSLISLLRGLAALVAAAAHLRAQVYPGFGAVAEPPLLFQGLAFGAGFAYLAVIVFFVLSGWLVGGSFLNKLDSDRALQNYTIDRVSRLWVVLVPTGAGALGRALRRRPDAQALTLCVPLVVQSRPARAWRNW